MSDGPIQSPARGHRAPEPTHGLENENDPKLLHQFVARRDEAAFAVLVERHAPMVQAVCRRVLRDAHEAEDACQATFLVLARKAGSLRRPELLANWLYGVAYRSARKAQRRLVRHSAHAIAGAVMRVTDPTPEVVWRDLRPVLDAELNRLPGKYRTAVVMCYLEGATTEDAARHLGCPRGTILSRLARGRERLRKRLVRRGLVLSTGILGLLLAKCASAAMPLPQEFIHATAKAARLFAVGRSSLTGVIPRFSVEIACDLLRDMRISRLAGVAVCLVSVGIVIFGVGWGFLARKPAVHANQEIASEKHEEKANDRVPAKGVVPRENSPPKDDKETIQGTWRGVTLQMPGKAPEPSEAITFTFTGDKVTIDCNLFPGQPFNPTFSFRLNSQARPKTFDMYSVDAQKKEMLEMIGIYELDGDKLKLCSVVANSGERPNEFKAKDTQMVWVFKRESTKEGELPKKP